MKKLNEKIYINKAITDFMQLMFFLMNFVQSMEYKDMKKTSCS